MRCGTVAADGKEGQRLECGIGHKSEQLIPIEGADGYHFLRVILRPNGAFSR